MKIGRLCGSVVVAVPGTPVALTTDATAMAAVLRISPLHGQRGSVCVGASGMNMKTGAGVAKMFRNSAYPSGGVTDSIEVRSHDGSNSIALAEYVLY
jgi:hypothetical protein